MKNILLKQKKPFCGLRGGGGFMQPFKLTHNSRRAVIRQTGNGIRPEIAVVILHVKS